MSRNSRSTRIAGLVAAGALSSLAFAGSPALAITLQPAGSVPTLVVPVMDQEDMEVKRDLEPDQVPETKSGGEMVPVPDRADSISSNVEDEELKRDLETGD
ncbi:MAG: hypothetical protein QNJ62_07295 [Methyloceanibacter sp.]|nr:hypothetical protein [Methyloceanibacter sp.]